MSTSKSFLTDSDLSLLEDEGTVVSYKTSQVIFHQRTPDTPLYWIKKGVVQIDCDRLFGSHVLGYLSKGDMFGVISFLDHADTNVNASATEDAEILEVPRDLLETMLGKDDGFAARFYHTVAMTMARQIRSSTRT